jgi:hypothetical protein
MSKPRRTKKKKKSAHAQYEVEQILAVRMNSGAKTVHSCLIKWKDYDDTHNSWEPDANVDATPARKEALTHIWSNDAKWQWEYYLAAPQDGYAAGWYPFDQSAQDKMSHYLLLYCHGRKAIPGELVIVSGPRRYSYRIDIEAMTQTNAHLPSKMTRPIRCTPKLE